MKKTSQKERTPKRRNNPATAQTNDLSKIARSAEASTLIRPVDPIMHKMCFEDELPINCKVRNYLAKDGLNGQEDKILSCLLLQQYAWDIAKQLLQQSPIRQDYLNYRVESFFTMLAFNNSTDKLDIPDIISGYLQSTFE